MSDAGTPTEEDVVSAPRNAWETMLTTMIRLQEHMTQITAHSKATSDGVVAALNALTTKVSSTTGATAGPSSSSTGTTISPALRKLQEKDPEFPPYDGNPENFLSWIVTVEERKNNRKLDDQVAITFALNALGSHARGAIEDGATFADWDAFVEQLKKRFCADSFEYNVAWRLNNMKVHNGNFQFYVSQFAMGRKLLKGSVMVPDLFLRYCFILGLEPDMQAEIINKKLLDLDATIEAAWDYFRKPRAPPKVIIMASPETVAVPTKAAMDLDALRYGNSPFGGNAAFETHPTSTINTRSLPRGSLHAVSASSTGGLLEVPGDLSGVGQGGFFGALADHREVLYREKLADPAMAPVPQDPGLHATRAPPNVPRGGGPRPHGDRGGRGRGMPGRVPGRGGGGGRWPQRPVVQGYNRSNSPGNRPQAAAVVTTERPAFARSPMEEARQQQPPPTRCFYCGEANHYIKDCPQAIATLGRGIPTRAAEPGTVPATTVKAETSLK